MTLRNTVYPFESVAPLVDARDQDLCGHAVQFYVDDSYLLDGLSRFVGASLGAGDATVVIASLAHARGLTTRLRECNLDLDSAIRQGRYVSLDANATLASFMVDGWPDSTRFIESVGGVIARAAANARGSRPRVTVFGEMVALLWADGHSEAALHLERLWNDLAKTHDFDLHCAYPMSLFPHAKDGPSFSRICAEHSHVTPDESYISLQTDHGVGVLAEHREAIFDRFHQAHGVGHLSGMGLGLYISREIVEQHGGSLRLEERQHAGSRFVISLPALTKCTQTPLVV